MQPTLIFIRILVSVIYEFSELAKNKKRGAGTGEEAAGQGSSGKKIRGGTECIKLCCGERRHVCRVTASARYRKSFRDVRERRVCVWRLKDRK